MKFIFSIIFFNVIIVNFCDGAKILGIFPTMAKSHYIVGSSVMKELAKRGHEVTVISPFPQKVPLHNYRDINIPGILTNTKHILDNLINLPKRGIFDSLFNMYNIGVYLTNLTFQESSVQNLIHSSTTNEKFDLIIMEIFMNEALLGFGYKFNAPVIGVSTFGACSWTTDMIGTPSPPSYVPNPFLSLTHQMTFIERFSNFIVIIFEKIYIDFFYLPHQIQFYNENFQNFTHKPTLHELRKNVSLILLNNHFSLNYPRPYLPNMIEVGGMHINRQIQPLPSKMKEFLETDADHGVIYFSMGSNIKCKLLPMDKLNALLNTFRALKQKVLWKWEDLELPNKPDNVYINNWFPQNDILAHPNVKLFITHGGLLSTTEAIYFGVPIIGIPMFGDQFLNMAHASKSGIGLTINYQDLTEPTLTNAIQLILNKTNGGETSKYVKNIAEISKRYRDQPMTPLETAIFWIEYVLRHQGAPHIKSAGQLLSFLEYHNIDVLILLFCMIFLIIYLMYFMIMKVLGLRGRKYDQNHEKTS